MRVEGKGGRGVEERGGKEREGERVENREEDHSYCTEEAKGITTRM